MPVDRFYRRDALFRVDRLYAHLGPSADTVSLALQCREVPVAIGGAPAVKVGSESEHRNFAHGAI
jgi:hypothetical protein